MLALAMAGCAAKYNYAPVADVSGYEAVPVSGVYRVVSSDTLYSIAWRYGMDYEVLARLNQIEAPYSIHVGQVIYLRADHPVLRRETVAKTEPVAVATASASKASTRQQKQSVVRHQKKLLANIEPNYQVTGWMWPAQGQVLSVFSKRNKGIDIGAKLGSPVLSALPGKVVYAGNGLRGYGNLILIKHNSQTLSAYAYNKRLYVKEGQWVKKGQKVASIGVGPNRKPMLHFEIRRAGLPVNPLKLLRK